MNKTKIFTTLLTLPVLTGAFLVSANLAYATADECSAEKDLQGNVTRNEATVTNYSTNDACTYDATLAIYESPKEPETYGWIEAQKLIGKKTVTVKAGETVSIKVDGSASSCNYQSDLIRGSEVFETPYYRNAMDVDVYKSSDSCKAAPTPTPTSSTGTGGNSSTTSTPTENKVITKLAETGNIALVYGFIAAGFVTLLAGMLLKKADK